MELELVTVGTELVLGHTLDSNASELARALAAIGVRVARTVSVGDSEPAIQSVVNEALGRTGWVIVTGGLGPTSDDVTKKAVAAVFGVPLELDHDYLQALEARFTAFRGGPMPPSNRSQAEIPRGGRMLPNPRGTAPGIWLEGARGTVVLLPGVPHEMRGLLHHEVLPRLRRRLAADGTIPRVTRSRTLRTTGITESALASLLDGWEMAPPAATLAFLPSHAGVDVRVTVWNVPDPEADAALERAAAELVPVLGAHYYAEGHTDLAAVVLDRLRERGWRLAVAESCTGGLVGVRLTAIPGSSDVFLGGVISYSDASKTRELGVPEDLLRSAGAVSEPVVLAMVRGVTRLFGAPAGIAVTGIAGPAGGSEDKPVGTVWLAARLGEHERAARRRFPGGRHDVRRRSAQAGLDLLRRLVERHAGRGA